MRLKDARQALLGDADAIIANVDVGPIPGCHQRDVHVRRLCLSRILAEIDRLDEIARAFSRYGMAPAERRPAESVDLAATVDLTAAPAASSATAIVPADSAIPSATTSARPAGAATGVATARPTARAAGPTAPASPTKPGQYGGAGVAEKY